MIRNPLKIFLFKICEDCSRKSRILRHHFAAKLPLFFLFHNSSSSQLYSDDKKVLPESEWVTTDAGKVLKSLGKINSYYALKTFGVNAQPYYVLQGRGGKELVPPRGYDLDVQGFVDFLRSGVEAYDRQK